MTCSSCTDRCRMETSATFKLLGTRTPSNRNPSCKGPTRTMPGSLFEEAEHQEGQKHLDMDVCEPAGNTVWASPIVFAPNRDGTIRFCVDYRKLNIVSVWGFYPLTRMKECIDSLGETQVITSLGCVQWLLVDRD